ncbi:hypothetical protein [Lactiplantibacillus pingfangensis]|uniref:hypothetical protein n=1 Tax=Lactiplantibacillus pingfangensis TaxID=2559915 RepID=UPI0014858205|nr:hypothetical protein [Lactiplantibacillus pingfangensis]
MVGTTFLSDAIEPNLLQVGTDHIGRDGGVTSAVFCRRYTTDGPGHLRFLQGFRARSKTLLAWTGPTTACDQFQPEVTAVFKFLEF